jgi:hypothetical protein
MTGTSAIDRGATAPRLIILRKLMIVCREHQ